MVELLKSNIRLRLMGWFFLAGLVIGVSGWWWGASRVPPYLLALASGLHWGLIFLLAVNAVCSVVAYWYRGKLASLIAGDAINSFRWVSPLILRAIAVLAGVDAVALLCWFVTDSYYALGVCVNTSFLCLGLAWIWGCLVVIADGVKRRWGF